MSVISTWHSGVICLVAAVGCCGQVTPSRFSGFLACFRLMVLLYLSRLISPELNTSSNLNTLCSSWEKFAETKREITSVSSNKPKLNTSWVEKWVNSGRDNKYGEEKMKDLKVSTSWNTLHPHSEFFCHWSFIICS